jgi:transcriptional regulator with XRE-family HTH domain
VNPAVARVRFGRFVDRAFASARSAGLSDRDVARISKVATSTFHRWRNAEGKRLPEAAKVKAFCEATGASYSEALHVLGLGDEPPAPTPEDPLPRDVQIIMRRLADPNTPKAERDFIRMALQMLAARQPGSSSDAVAEAS